MKKRNSVFNSRGIAMAFVAGAVLILPAILFSVHNYVSTKTRDMAWINARKKLEYQVLNALTLTSEKLRQGRWYGDDASGSFDLQEDGISVRVYCDDYVQTKRRLFSAPEPGLYVMLDHIKIFVDAKLDNFSFCGYAKFIISPEPLYQGKSTEGIDYHVDDFTVTANTLRQLTNFRMGTPSEYAHRVSGFKELSDSSSRRLLGDFFEAETNVTARNYYHTSRMQPAVSRMFDQRFQSFSKPMFRSLVKSLESYSDLENQDVLKNHFIVSNFQRFVPELDFSASDEQRQAAVKEVSIRSLPPERTAQSPEARKLLRSVFGSEHPVSADSSSRAHARSWYFAAGRDAMSHFMEDLSLRPQQMDSPTDFIDKNFRFPAFNSYRFVWEARCSNQPERGGFELFDRYLKDWQAGKFLFKDPRCGTSPDFQVGKKIGPEPEYGDYFIRRGENGPEFSVAAVLHFFRKMVDGSGVIVGPDKKTELYIPDVAASRAGGAVRLVY
jgi:hypothetical protein